MQKNRLLFLNAGLAMPEKYIGYCKRFERLSEVFTGDIIVHGTKESLEISTIGDFGFHPIRFFHNPGIARNILFFCKAVWMATSMHYRGRKFDCIISSDPLLSGITAIVIGFITKRKVIIEVNGSFESAFKYEKQAPSFTAKIKEALSQTLIPWTIERANRVRLLYPEQLQPFRKLNSKHLPVDVFAEFVPIELFLTRPRRDGKYILLLGFPWYLKGVDVLIKAFKQIAADFPDYRLKIVGWCPEGLEYFEDLAKDNHQIELCDAVDYEEVITLMTGCSLYVLASRTEAMGRVLLEAMASEKPIIASKVDGTSMVIKDGFNGLFFESENVDELSEKISLLLTNKELASTLARNGLDYVTQNLSETCYLRHYEEMIEQIMNHA